MVFLLIFYLVSVSIVRLHTFPQLFDEAALQCVRLAVAVAVAVAVTVAVAVASSSFCCCCVAVAVACNNSSLAVDLSLRLPWEIVRLVVV